MLASWPQPRAVISQVSQMALSFSKGQRDVSIRKGGKVGK